MAPLRYVTEIIGMILQMKGIVMKESQPCITDSEQSLLEPSDTHDKIKLELSNASNKNIYVLTRYCNATISHKFNAALGPDSFLRQEKYQESQSTKRKCPSRAMPRKASDTNSYCLV